MLIHEATLKVPATALLSAIWYLDGSGAAGLSAGIDGLPENWHVENVRLEDDGGEQWICIDLIWKAQSE